MTCLFTNPGTKADADNDPLRLAASAPASAEILVQQAAPRIRTAIPEDFLDLSAGDEEGPGETQPDELITDTYVDGVFTGVVILAAEGNDYRISDPHKLIGGIEALTDLPAFAAQLSLPLSIISERYCKVTPETSCVAPLPSDGDKGPLSAVIFDPSGMRLDLYRPARDNTGPKLLAPSHPDTRGALVSLRGQISRRQSRGLSQADGAVSYRLVAGQGPTSVFADGSLSASAAPSVRRIGVQRYVSGNRFALGVVQSGGSTLAAQSRLIGLEAGNEPALRPRADPAQSQPVLVFLNARALVSIFREDELIFSEFLEAGPQSIPTGRFPPGSYMIDIQVEPETGTASRQSRFFSNASSLSNNLVWRANLGVLNASGSPDRPGSDQSGKLIAGLSVSGINVGDVRMAGQVGIIADNAFAEISAGRNWERISLNGTVRATGSGFGASVRANGQIGPASVTTDLRMTKGNYSGAAGPGDRRISLSTSVGVPIADVQINGFANISKVDRRKTEASLGLNAARSFRLGGANGLVSASLQRTSRETSAGIRFTLRQRIGDMSVSGFAGFDGAYREDAPNRTSSSYGAEASLRYRSELFGDPSGSLRLVSDNANNTRLSASVRAKTEDLQLNLRTLNSYGNSNASALTATAETLLVLAPSGYALSSETGAQGGLLIRQKARSGAAPILASATGGHRLSLGRTARFIPARPFAPTRISFRSTGRDAAEIDASVSSVLAFPGNIVPVTARVRRLITVYGQVLGSGNEPLRNAHLRAGDIDFLSDDEGFFVADILEETRTIAHLQKGQVVCRIENIPAGAENILNLGVQACTPPLETAEVKPRLLF